MKPRSQTGKKIYQQAMAESGCTQFFAETKILFPNIERILVRATEIITDKLPSLSVERSLLVTDLLLNIREVYNTRFQEWHAQEIIISELFQSIALVVEQTVDIAIRYEVQLVNGKLWSFDENGPLITVYDEIVSVRLPKNTKPSQKCSPKLTRYLFSSSELRMLELSIQKEQERAIQ